LLAGPNGAGKTTFARKFLGKFIDEGAFLNADDVALAISPNDVGRSAFAAGRIMLRRRAEFFANQESLVIETTLATQTLMRAVQSARKRGYEVTLIYLAVTDPDICIQRVAQRVAMGGHFIPADTIVRRFELSLLLLPKYLRESDIAIVYLADGAPSEILVKQDRKTRILDSAAHKWLTSVTKRKRRSAATRQASLLDDR
jgi:predicted ABC-type ATPase